MTNDKIVRRGLSKPSRSNKPAAESIETRPIDNAERDRTSRVSASPPPAIVNDDKGVSKCIYFHSGNELSNLEGLAGSIPRCTVSRIIGQLVKTFLAAAANRTNGAREVEVPTFKVYL